MSVPSAPTGPGSRPSPLRLGALAALAALAVAGVVAVVAVVDADAAVTAVGQGVGIGVVTFATGALLVCALACLARGTLELVSLLAVAVAGVTLDLVAIALWRDVQTDAYGKVVGVGFAWALVLFLVLALALAASRRGRISSALFVLTALAYAAVGVMLTDLVLRGENALGNPFGLLGEGVGSAELRVLGAAFAIGAAGWLATLVTSRLESAPR